MFVRLGFALGALAVPVFAMIACGPPAPVRAVPGVSTAGSATAPIGSSTITNATLGLALPPDYDKNFKLTRALAPSDGHAPGRFVSEIYMNTEAAAALQNERAFPVGAMLIERHEERRGTAKAGPTFMMEKISGDAGAWRFAAFDSKGKAVGVAVNGVVGSAKGPGMAACAQCHHDAARDYVFLTASTSAAPTAAAPSSTAGPKR